MSKKIFIRYLNDDKPSASMFFAGKADYVQISILESDMSKEGEEIIFTGRKFSREDFENSLVKILKKWMVENLKKLI